MHIDFLLRKGGLQTFRHKKTTTFVILSEAKNLFNLLTLSVRDPSLRSG
jgi:hypothetical protein